MELRDLLEMRKRRVRELDKERAELMEDISAIERVLAMADEPTVEVVQPKTLVSTKDLKATYGTFSKFLTQFMFENAVSATDMGPLLGATSASVSNWAAGRNVPSEAKAKAIADKLQDLSSNEFHSGEIMGLIAASRHA